MYLANLILIFTFYFLTLVIPEISAEYNYRVSNIGIINLHDFILLILLLLNIRKIISLFSTYKDHYIRIILIFLLFVISSGVMGYFLNNPDTFILREVRFLGYCILFFITVAIFENDYRHFFTLSIIIGLFVSLRGILDQSLGYSLIQNEFAPESLYLVSLGFDASFRSYSNPILIFTITYLLNQFMISKNPIYLLVLTSNIICLIYSFGRGQYLGLLSSLIIIYCLKRKYTLNYIFSASFAIIIITMFQNYFDIHILSNLANRFSLINDLFDSSNYARLMEVQYSMDMFFRNPFIGSGIGYRVNYWFLPSDIREGTDIHNTYLYFLVKTGLIGVLIFLTLLLKYIKLSYDCITKDADSPIIFSSLIGLSVLFGIGHFLSGSFFTGWFFSLLGIQYILFKRIILDARTH